MLLGVPQSCVKGMLKQAAIRSKLTPKFLDTKLVSCTESLVGHRGDK